MRRNPVKSAISEGLRPDASHPVLCDVEALYGAYIEEMPNTHPTTRIALAIIDLARHLGLRADLVHSRNTAQKAISKRIVVRLPVGEFVVRVSDHMLPAYARELYGRSDMDIVLPVKLQHALRGFVKHMERKAPATSPLPALPAYFVGRVA